MIHTSNEYPDKLNLDNCAKEPIHIIGHTQSHGVLVACDPEEYKITQVGKNTSENFGEAHETLLGKYLSYLLGEEQVRKLIELLNSGEIAVPQSVVINKRNFLMLAHSSGPNLILDFEPHQEVDDPYFFQKQLTLVLNKFQAAKSIDQLFKTATFLTKSLFGYDRVMIYKFDEEWNGEVVAESIAEGMDSWLGLHYPATDIPAQSRELFLKHRVRMISNVEYQPVPIIPQHAPLTGAPLDISQSGLRAVSPIHIEYLQNMKVGASLSAAIIVKGKLWGLIACHHRKAKYLDFYQRESCRFMTQMFSTELTLKETSAVIRQGKFSETLRRQLVVQMQKQKDVLAALSEDNVKFTQLISCGGGAIFLKERWKLIGNTPTQEQLESLLSNFIKKQSKSLFLTRKLSAVFPEAEDYKASASGLLCLKIAEDKYIFWFKPEEIQEVNWGGNPHNKAFFNEKEQRLGPRKSFEIWSEKLIGTSEAWQDNDKNIARALRENISYVLLAQQREEIEALNTKLIEANKELELFSYGLSHDLRAPVRGMEGFLTILEEDHREEVGEEGRKLLQMSLDLTSKMNDLIDDILEYSRLTHTNDLELDRIDTSELIEEVLEFFSTRGSYPDTIVKIEENLPLMNGDRRMLFQLWANLLNNALKYSSEKKDPQVEVGTTKRKGKQVFYVKDNGIGIPPKFKTEIFETFKRAVGSRFKGTGIGLAIVKQIVDKHNGKVWVESEPDNGSEFYFYLEPESKFQSS